MNSKIRKPMITAGLAMAVWLSAVTPSLAIVWYEPATGPQTFAEIVLDSTLGVRGQVIDVVTHSLEGPTVAYPNLYSEILIEVEEAYIGAAAGDRVIVRQYGGFRASDGYWTDIAGLYAYRPGEAVILFQNDSKMPMYASYKADRGMRRLAALDRGERIVLTQQGTPFLHDGDGYTLDIKKCVQDDRDPRRCEAWVDEEGNQGREPGAEAVTVEEFDALIRGILATGTPPSGPAQTVTTDSEFRTLMTLFIAGLESSQSPREVDPITGAQ